MLIKSLELKNIKSHQETGPVIFSDGVNAICGQTGVGKTTILEAIGLAVFDSSLYKQDFFVREGSKSGEIIVRIVDIIDEREYEIVRPIKRGAPYVFDPEIHRKLVEGKVEVFNWLKEHLKLEPSTNLPALFEDAIGVPQGLFTAAFLENLSTRKNKFDPLLQVEDYERVWGDLNQSNRYIKDLMEDISREIARLEGRLEELPKRKRQKTSVKKDISNDKYILKTNQDRYKIVRKEKTSIDTIKKKIDEANQRIGIIENNITNQEKQISSADSLLKEASKAEKIFKECTKEHERYLAAEEKLKGLEEKYTEFKKLQGEFADIAKNLEIESQKHSGKEKYLQEYSSAKIELEKLEPLVKSQAEIEKSLENAKESSIKYDNVQKSMLVEKKTLKDLEGELEEIKLGLGKLDKSKNVLKQTKDQENILAKEVNQLSGSIQSLEKNLEEIQTRQKLFAEGSGKEAVCPVCRQEIDANQIENLQEHYQKEIDEIKSKLQVFHSELKLKNSSFNKIGIEIQNIEGQIEALPKITQLNSIDRRVEKSKFLIADLEKKEKDLSKSKQLVIDLVAELKALEDPRSRKLYFSKLVHKHKEIEEEIKELKLGIKMLERNRIDLGKQLKEFSGIEAEIEAQKKILEETKPAHNLYIKNENTAKSLEEREENKKQLESELKELEKELKDESNNITDLKGNFDEIRFKQLGKEVTLVEQNIAKLDARITEKEIQLTEIEKEIQELLNLQKENRELEKKQERFVRAQEILQFIRDIIRKTGPYVKRALVQLISLEAKEIFGDVISDHTMQLSWDEDYLIKIENQSNVRDWTLPIF